LTGLYNRRTLFSKSNELLEENPTTTMWAIMVDVDNFKMINDSHGHAYGDLILQTIGESLQSFTSPILIAGRLGGDEFVIITTDPDIKSLASAINSQILQRIDVVRKSDQPVTLSMGVSCLNLATYTDENPLEQLILEADQALYRAKDQGKNQIFFATGRRTRRTFTKQEH
ncbi:MAG: GGDEF domain-containing protein, partial [Sphaerochaeta sp.]